MSELNYEVLVNDGLRRQREQTLPDGSPIISSPIASTLIYGERDAVLVDPQFTYEQVSRVGDWIEASGKHLTAVYATHGHGDHWFGTALLQQRFPHAVAYATNGTIEMMHHQGTSGRAQLWDIDFPGLIPPSPVNYRTIPVDGIELEDHRLLAVEVGHTDTGQRCGEDIVGGIGMMRSTTHSKEMGASPMRGAEIVSEGAFFNEELVEALAAHRASRLDGHASGYSPIDTTEWSPSGSTKAAVK